MAFASGYSILVPAVITSLLAIGLVRLEMSKQGGELVEYESQGWIRECAVWDSDNRRFLVSFMDGGLGQINGGKEETLVKEADLAGNATLGFKIDRPRNRLVVAVADMLGNKYSAVAAYDMATWRRLFLTRLSGSPEDGMSLADDVAVDTEGNAYVTDVRWSRIWKVGPDGAEVAVFSGPAFRSVPAKLPFNLAGLNGIVYHPGGYLLVVHTWSGALFKVSLDGSHVRAVNMSSSVLTGDGLALVSPERLAVAGTPSARIVESTDDWQSAKITHRYVGPMHRVATSVTVKDGKVFVSHLLGFGLGKRKHLITEAVFKSVTLAN